MKIQLSPWRLLLAASCLVVAGLSLKAATAATRTATDLTLEAVRAAIDAAQDGDTVQLPAGRIVWRKGLNSGRSVKMKAIIVQGAGMDQTIIGDDRSQAPDATFALMGVEGKPFRITGITFDGSDYPNSRTGYPLMDIRGTCKNFRIDHCKFKNSDGMIHLGGLGEGDTFGLIDHCYFDGHRSHGGNVQPIGYVGPGAANYRKPLSYGTSQALYLEDNEVHIGAFAGTGGTRTGNNPWIAPNNCARVVIRRNKIVNSQIEIYSPGMNKLYGCQQCEIYDNQFSTEGEGRPQCSVFIGAGTGMVFNNTVTGPRNWRIILLANHRAHGVMTEPFGKADGTSPFDGNQIPAGQVGAGYPCMGQVGRATNLKGTGVFESTPAYCWNNTIDGKELRMAVSGRDPNEAAQIKEGRDFFNEKPPEEYYKPYVYPHPLQQGWDSLMKSVAVGSAGADSRSAPATWLAGKPRIGPRLATSTLPGSPIRVAASTEP